MRTPSTTTKRIRSLIRNGYSNKYIINKLQCKPQAVYNIRYQVNKERGLGSIGTLPKPTDGIGAPPKRKYTRRVKAGTGIDSVPKVGDNVGGLVLTEVGGGALRWVRPPNQHPTMTEPLVRVEPYAKITMIEEPTLWQRVKEWFRG